MSEIKGENPRAGTLPYVLMVQEGDSSTTAPLMDQEEAGFVDDDGLEVPIKIRWRISAVRNPHT